MKVLVIGANGKTGKRIVQQLAVGAHDPLAMIRHPGQRADFDELGVPTVLADLEYPIDHAVKGCEAVIFAAGSGSKTGRDKTVLVDHLGAIRSMVTARVHNARRYIMLSATNSDPRSESTIAHYHRAKGHADNHLRETDLDYTILCPGGLTDAPAGGATVDPDWHVRGTTSRNLLADAIVACLDLPNTVGKTFSLLDGDTPLDDALQSL